MNPAPHLGNPTTSVVGGSQRTVADVVVSYLLQAELRGDLMQQVRKWEYCDQSTVTAQIRRRREKVEVVASDTDDCCLQVRLPVAL